MPIVSEPDKSVPEKRSAESQTNCKRKRLKKLPSRLCSTSNDLFDEVEILEQCQLNIKQENSFIDGDKFQNGFQNKTTDSNFETVRFSVEIKNTNIVNDKNNNR